MQMHADVHAHSYFKNIVLMVRTHGRMGTQTNNTLMWKDIRKHEPHTVTTRHTPNCIYFYTQAHTQTTTHTYA